MWGVVVFTPILWAVSSFLPEGVSELRDLIYGVLLIVILIIKPEGVIDKIMIHDITAKGRLKLRRLVKPGKFKA